MNDVKPNDALARTRLCLEEQNASPRLILDNNLHIHVIVSAATLDGALSQMLSWRWRSDYCEVFRAFFQAKIPALILGTAAHNTAIPVPRCRLARAQAVLEVWEDRPDRHPPRSSGSDGTTSTMRGGLQLGPPGRWWDDKGFAKSLGLRPEQRKKMDDIFNVKKGTILLRYQSLQQEEARLEDITREPRLDEPTIFAAIDRVAQARAALERANAHMLLLIRQEMDKNQTERLGQHRWGTPISCGLDGKSRYVLPLGGKVVGWTGRR